MAMPVGPDGGQYPYGLQISLEEDDLNKLGIEDLPAVGTEIKGTFTGTVTATRLGATGNDRSMTIQVCCLQMDAEVEAGESDTQSEASEAKGAYRPMGKPGAIVE
jgi:hypothetical protein